ncbi:MAG: hypothetical protein IKL46_00200 [Clostridia bacterium]|nr:hypothetical protein [Clostridia bacterium]
MNDMISLISNVGFPIAAAVAMGWYVNKKDKEHKSEIDRLSNVVENNTLILNKIYEHISERNDN